MRYTRQIEDHFGGIRTLSEGRGTQLLVGTTRNCILVGDIEMGFNPAMLGHTEEVWGLAAHPTLPQFATAAHDRLLQMWDSLSHTVVWSKDIGVHSLLSNTVSPHEIDRNRSKSMSGNKYLVNGNKIK